MSVEFYRESPGKFDSRTLSRETLSRWTGRICIKVKMITILIVIIVIGYSNTIVVKILYHTIL